MKFYVIPLMFILAALLSTPTFAGTKSKSKIVIRNNTNATFAVVVNPSQSLQNATTPQQFVARGGKILNPGESATFKVKAGSSMIGAAVVTNGVPSAGDFTQRTVQLNKNQTLWAWVSPNAQGAAVITVR